LEENRWQTILTDSVRKLLTFARYRDGKMPIAGTQRLLFANDPPTEQVITRRKDEEASFFERGVKICDRFDELVAALNQAVEGGVP
jgi:hypothetical protein